MEPVEWDRELRELQQALAEHGYRFDASVPGTWTERHDAAWLCVGLVERLLFARAIDEQELTDLHARATALTRVATQRASKPPR